MKYVLALLLAFVAVPSISKATYGHGGGDIVVAAHEQLVVDCYMDLTAGHYNDSMDNLVDFANSYANQRQVVVRVIGRNHANVVAARRANFRVAVRKNVRVVFVQQQQVVRNRAQVQVVVRAGRRGLLNRVFNAGFNRRARAQADQVIRVRVRS